MPEKQSLVGLFGKDGSVDMGSGSAKCDAYLWAMDKYFDRCSSRYIAYILDGASCSRNNPCFHPENPSNVFENCIYNHDYYIARRCFFFDLTVYDKEAPIDDPNQPLGTDRETSKKFSAAAITEQTAKSVSCWIPSLVDEIYKGLGNRQRHSHRS